MRGVRIIVVGIGPDARKPKYCQVLEFIGGENLFFVDDYASVTDATRDIKTLICRKLKFVVLAVLSFELSSRWVRRWPSEQFGLNPLFLRRIIYSL